MTTVTNIVDMELIIQELQAAERVTTPPLPRDQHPNPQTVDAARVLRRPQARAGESPLADQPPRARAPTEASPSQFIKKIKLLIRPPQRALARLDPNPSLSQSPSPNLRENPAESQAAEATPRATERVEAEVRARVLPQPSKPMMLLQ
jgi:hypothetical protein